MTKSIHTEVHRKLVETIRQARLGSGLTQIDVAERLGKPQSYVAKIEGAERRIDMVEFLLLAKAIGFDPAVVVEELRKAF